MPEAVPGCPVPLSALRTARFRSGRIANALPSGVADPLEEAVGRHLGDPFPTIRALLQMLVDRLGRTVVELAQAVRAQGLVGRMDGLEAASIGRSPGTGRVTRF